jgi:fatty-acyl-CoA synthase
MTHARILDAFDQPYIDLDKPAVITDKGHCVTYREFADRTRRLARVLRDHGLQVGDVVAVVWENSAEYLEITWACRLAGLYYVTVNTHFGADEAAYCITDSGASALIASCNVSSVTDLGSQRTPNVTLRLLGNGALDGWEDFEDALQAAEPFELDTDLEGDLLQYSSGTTGRPKGIKRELRPRPANKDEDRTAALAGLIGVSPDAVYMTPAPLYHTAPIMWTLAALRIGATVVLMTKFDAEECLRVIEEHRVTHGQFVPTMFVRMLKLDESTRTGFDLSSLQGVVHAAAPCPVQIKREMLAWWGPIINEYWSSSEGAGFTFISAQEWLERPGSVGKPWIGELHIADAEGNELPVGETGMIWSSQLAKYDYLNDPDKTAAGISPQGWRSVGDVGRVDEDGYLYLTDRASFMIISGGVNIYPQEAENVLIEHPSVLDAAVIGIPDEDLGEVAIGIVQLVNPDAQSPELAAELIDACQRNLAKYKCPRRIEFTENLPRTETGKLVKRQLRDKYWA